MQPMWQRQPDLSCVRIHIFFIHVLLKKAICETGRGGGTAAATGSLADIDRAAEVTSVVIKSRLFRSSSSDLTYKAALCYPSPAAQSTIKPGREP